MRAARYAALLAAIYAAIAGAYIWLSGALAARVAANVHDLERIERLKGLLFVATTATLLGVAAWILFFRMHRLTRDRERLRQAIIVTQGRAIAGEMAAAVAHDFNNALMVLEHAHAATGASASDVAQAVEYARKLTRQLAKTARGERRLNPEPRDLARTTRSTVASVSRLPRFAGKRFEVDTAADATAVVDGLLFEQILTNLVINAGDVGSKIRVNLRLEAEHVRLEVHDDGPGIPVERRKDVFSAFETTKPDGLGLGLLSARIAVEMQGGTIAVAASPLGGAAFVVTLPREPPPVYSAPVRA
jgi:signal transduction histidine kinase